MTKVYRFMTFMLIWFLGCMISENFITSKPYIMMIGVFAVMFADLANGIINPEKG